jgi:hypothetical protein
LRRQTCRPRRGDRASLKTRSTLEWVMAADPLLVQPRKNVPARARICCLSRGAASATEIVYERGIPTRASLVVVCGMRPSAFETVAARMLARDGVEVIWQLHLRAAASHARGNWLSALALVGIADIAERLWRNNR